MNQDASATPVAQPSPSQGYISGSSDSKSKTHMAQKRASRAGTRSVTTLSAAQLERKRANDREAQRAIRKRTKDQIAELQDHVKNLTITLESREKMLVATQQRNRELAEENGYLKTRLGNEAFAMGSVTEADGKDRPPSPQSASQRLSPASASRGLAMGSLHNPQHPDAWRNPGLYVSSGGPATTSFLTETSQSNSGPNAASWRAHDASEAPQTRVNHGSREFTSVTGSGDVKVWAGSGPGYGYQVRPTDRTTSYPGASQSLSYPTQSQPTQFQTAPAVSGESTAVSSVFHTTGIVPHNDYQQIPSYPASQQTAFHDQPPTSYQVSHGQVPSSEFTTNGSNVRRTGLGPLTYNQATSSPQFLQSQPGHGQGIPIAYRDSPTQHPYSYDS